ncbi:hypothetical protein SAMN05444959_102450 [Paracoccus seriniphilus]|uniref:Uncharacterized protein n=1 Tax=Paracoccus seriniphilus TaxID=184748 RepID=A0A239PP72_9RHOB|nr:hypothetical protein SAMN05444959_102450 [Paracoccus seriniphilus]
MPDVTRHENQLLDDIFRRKILDALSKASIGLPDIVGPISDS